MMFGEEAIEVDEELTHDGDEGDFLGLSGSDELLVEGCQNGVVTGRAEGGHVEGLADAGPAAVDGTFAAHGAAVAVERGEAGEAGGLVAVEVTELRHGGEEDDGGVLTDAFDFAQDEDRGLERRAGGDGCPQEAIELFNLGLKGANAALDDWGEGFGGLGVLGLHFLATEFVKEVTAVFDEGVEFFDLGIELEGGGGAMGGTEVGEDGGVNGVGFGKVATGAGVAADLAGIEAGAGDLVDLEPLEEGFIVAASGLENEVQGAGGVGAGGVLVEKTEEGGEAGWGVGELFGKLEKVGLMRVELELGFGDVDADPEGIWGGGRGLGSGGGCCC